MAFGKKPPSSMKIRSVCKDGDWTGDWVDTPNEALQSYAQHVADKHRDRLADPKKFNDNRKDEFDYNNGEPAAN